MNQIFANHDFNAVKNGMTATYSKPPYQEDKVTDNYRLAEYGSDVFTINCSRRRNGRNKYVKIKIF
jgi:hypothetical protein